MGIQPFRRRIGISSPGSLLSGNAPQIADVGPSISRAAGQVFEWTETPAGKGRSIVKGGSWDDKGCGVCRPAAGHSRPDTIKHILIGFRLVQD